MWKVILRAFSERCFIIHPVVKHHRGALGEVVMAEEAIGLCKSLGWEVTWGLKDRQELNEEPQEIGSETSRGRKLVKRPGYTIDGEKLKDGDEVTVGGIEGIYKNGGFLVKIDNSDSDDDFVLDEWTDENLRERIAMSCIQRVRQVSSSHFFGKGKVQEIGALIEEENATMVFINSTISSAQQRNLEDMWNKTERGQAKKVSVIDRFGIILRIFSERAKTPQSKLQLELAWLKYIRARLVRGTSGTMGGLTGLFRGTDHNFDAAEMEIVSAKGRGTSGRGAMGGEGEKQLEIEKRRLVDYEAKLRGQLQTIQQRSERRNKDPKLKHCPSVAIIGYTNAGKTALMNFLAGENLLSANMLFQTLNTTARKLSLPSGQNVNLLDTVGFISDLPHDLVEAFKATLEGVQYADVILHIRDISHPCSELQKATVFQVLEEIGATTSDLFSRYVEVWNKVDLIENPLDLQAIADSPYKIVPISAVYGINCNKLLEVLDEVVCGVSGRQIVKLKFPVSEFSKRIKWVRDELQIIQPKTTLDESYAYMEIPMDELAKSRYKLAFPEAIHTKGRKSSKF